MKHLSAVVQLVLTLIQQDLIVTTGLLFSFPAEMITHQHVLGRRSHPTTPNMNIWEDVQTSKMSTELKSNGLNTFPLKPVSYLSLVIRVDVFLSIQEQKHERKRK